MSHKHMSLTHEGRCSNKLVSFPQHRHIYVYKEGSWLPTKKCYMFKYKVHIFPKRPVPIKSVRKATFFSAVAALCVVASPSQM